jgi:geranylgeranyl diphosphate synthase type II
MNNNFVELERYLEKQKKVIDESLFGYVKDKVNFKIWESMTYSLMAGGKRLRPVLTLATSELFDTNSSFVIPSACAIEMIHTQSLIHDDLPGMDNDDLRRGKPTNHIVFGEAVAIIAGDALFALAFHTIANKTPKGLPPERLLKVIEELSNYSGADGMCGGQAMDITFEKSGKDIDEETLKFIHTHKTGDMIKVSVRAGAILSGASESELSKLTSYSEAIGLAFQIIDDVMDVTSTAEQMGKKTNKDINKATYPRFYGVEKSLEMAQNQIDFAINILNDFGAKADMLKLLAQYVVRRKN